MLFFIFLSTCILNVSAQLVQIGNCIDVPGIKNFQQEKFLGLWYEIERVENQLQLDEKCTQYIFTANNNHTMNLHGQTINIISGGRQHWDATAVLRDEISADYELIFPSYAFINAANGTIVDTDYNEYAVTYICYNENGYSFAYFNVLSRTNKLQDDHMARVLNIMMKYNVPLTMLIATDQEDCPQRLN